MKPLTLSLIGLSLVLATGCVAQPKLAQQAQDGLVSVGGDFATAGAHVDAAVPHADSVGKAELGQAKAAITHGAGLVPGIEQNVAALAAHDAKETAIANDYENSIFGGKTRRAAWWVVAGFLAVVIGYILLVGFGLSGTGPVQFAVAMIGRVLGVFIPVIGAAGNWLADHIFLHKYTNYAQPAAPAQGVSLANLDARQASVSAPLAGTFIKQ